METLPVTAPAAVGANLTENVTVCEGLRVTGNVRPVTVKPVPVTLACEMVTFCPPVLVRVSDRVALLPTVTLPNERLVGFADRLPAVTPVPVSGIFNVGFEPFDV